MPRLANISGKKAVQGFVLFVVGLLVGGIVRHSTKSLGSSSAGLLSTVAWYAIVIFTGLFQGGLCVELHHPDTIDTSSIWSHKTSQTSSSG